MKTENFEMEHIEKIIIKNIRCGNSTIAEITSEFPKNTEELKQWLWDNAFAFKFSANLKIEIYYNKYLVSNWEKCFRIETGTLKEQCLRQKKSG